MKKRLLNTCMKFKDQIFATIHCQMITIFFVHHDNFLEWSYITSNNAHFRNQFMQRMSMSFVSMFELCQQKFDESRVFSDLLDDFFFHFFMRFHFRFDVHHFLFQFDQFVSQSRNLWMRRINILMIKICIKILTNTKNVNVILFLFKIFLFFDYLILQIFFSFSNLTIFSQQLKFMMINDHFVDESFDKS